jgi:hypothetical protein
MADDVCGKESTFGVIARQEFDHAEPVIFILPERFKSYCRFIPSTFLDLYFPELLAETRDTHTPAVSQSGTSYRLHRTTDYATVLLPLPGISNDLVCQFRHGPEAINCAGVNNSVEMD